ncbi:MAG: RNA polymerase sigma-70 factor [Bacteroidota bacterium]|nr:RNA polymerase sigma-70 factor [Bacteroidota bacterium]MDP4228055.1 RNA polymerase sigma-70 factor [Bacteroidota bacterium]MDP4275925.1 RNA polymerase sigma-70 factor [Bacteroidota bacterium]
MECQNSGKYLIALIAQGDSDAFRKFYNRYFQKVFQFSRYFIKSEDLIQEIVSDVFLNLWNNRKKLPEIENLDSYLYTITKNKTFDYLDKISRKPEFVRDLPLGILTQESNPEEILLTEELEQTINSAIDELPEQCKLIFLMSREEGLKYKDIAQILSISEKTVNAQIVTAIKKLGIALNEHFN